MGILGFLFKKKDEMAFSGNKPSESPHKVSDVSEWFDLTLGSSLKKAHSESLSLCNKVMDNFSNMKESAQYLENAVFESGDKTYAATNMVKNTYVKKISSILQTIQPPKNADYTSLMEFYNNSLNSLNSMKKLSPRQMFFLSTYFKESSSRIMSDVTSIDKQLKVLSEFINSDGKLMKLHEEICQKSKDHTFLLKQEKALSMREEKISNEIELSEKKKNKYTSRINETKNSKEFKEMLFLIEQIEKLKKEVAEIESNINNEIYAIKRPLKKLEYETKRGRFFWINNPFKDVILNGKENLIKKAAEDIIELSNQGRIILKPREREKISTLLARMKDVKKLKEEYERNLQKIDENKVFMQDNFSELIKQKEELETTLTKEKERRKNLEIQKEAVAEEKENIIKELERQKDEMENIIFENSGKLVNINYKTQE